ncbi:Methionyl-tRNA formyltransferase [Serendipita sp. 399]|nr:Methionyl-tRNA formyltransferase [Serendipita sp. 399]
MAAVTTPSTTLNRFLIITIYRVFRHWDTDRSGTIEERELAGALNGFGYNLSPQLINLIANKYIGRTPSTIQTRASRIVQAQRSCSSPRFIHPRGPIKPLPVPDGAFDILFFGGDEFSCQTLRNLHAAKATNLTIVTQGVWNTLHVVTQEDTYKTERGKRLVESPVKLLAADLGLPCHLIPKDKSKLKAMHFPKPFHRPMNYPSQILIVSSLGRYIPWKVLKRFDPSRKLNLHPSLIPMYRGAAPIQRAIADGREETGVSIIEVERVAMGYDVGDIWAQKKIQPDSIEQDPSKATEAPAIDGKHAVVDWWKWDARMIEQVSRAFVHQKPIYSYVFDYETTLQLFDISIIPSEQHNPHLTSIGLAELNRKTGLLEVRAASDTQVAVGSVKQRNKKLIASKQWWIGVNDKKKVDGMIQFHMGPWRDEESHPDFGHSRPSSGNERV